MASDGWYAIITALHLCHFGGNYSSFTPTVLEAGLIVSYLMVPCPIDNYIKFSTGMFNVEVEIPPTQLAETFGIRRVRSMSGDGAPGCLK